jgi:signal transduction histidine kinase
MNNQIIAAPDLHLKSSISELQLFEAQVQADEPARHVMDFFDSHPAVPGVIVIDQGSFVMMLSRKIFFECISKPFSLELYLKRPIRVMTENIGQPAGLILPHTTPIVTAVQHALGRSEEFFTDPLVVETPGRSLRILDVHQLLQAHSHIHALALEQLREINQFKTELLGIASHDLKNPLNSIINIAKLMRGELEPDSFSHELSCQIYETSQHMLNLVLELLNSSVIETGRMELKKKLFDLRDIVSAIVWQNKSLADLKNQTIVYEVDSDGTYTIDGDGVKLRESMENLVSNAIKYSPKEAAITITLQRIDDTIFFAVKDQGPGLTDEDKKKLFGKFQRLSAQPTGGESSTGLGLYITRQIIDLHEGNIRVDSVLGEGCTFTIELPACDIPMDAAV